MKKWVREKAGELLARVSQEMEKTTVQPNEENVHDLRTSIRRTRETLSVFRDLFPEAEAKMVRKGLQSVMHLAAEIRNRDVALDLLENSGIAAVQLRRTLEAEREQARRELVLKLEELQKQDIHAEWKDALNG